MKKLSVEQIKELFEFHYEYGDLVTIKNHIEHVIENIDNGKYDNVSHESIYEQRDGQYGILWLRVYYEAMCDDTLVRTYICVATDYSLEYPERDLAVVKYLSP